MKCPNCNTENRDGAKFCRNCGKELVRNELSIREKYPEYSFEPTSITKVKGSPFWWILIVVLFFFLLIGIYVSFNALILDGLFHVWMEPESDEILAGIFATVLSAIDFYILKNVFKKIKGDDISSQYDYIECSNDASHHYRFVIKDSKFGLLNVKTKKEQIPCDFDYLKWKIKDKILMATMNGSQYEIDINGNKLK